MYVVESMTDPAGGFSELLERGRLNRGGNYCKNNKKKNMERARNMLGLNHQTRRVFIKDKSVEDRHHESKYFR